MFFNALENTQKNNTAVETDGDVKFSIREDINGNNVVVIDENILENVPKSKWISIVKEIMSKYNNKIDVWDTIVKVNSISKNEFVNSKYTKYLKAINKSAYKDKLLSANNIDEILLASTNKKIEDLKHERNDNFKQFVHSDVAIIIGDSSYIADAIVGITTNNNFVFYDIVDLKLSDIKIKQSPQKTMQNAGSLLNRGTANTIKSQSDTSVNNSISNNSEKVVKNAENNIKFSKNDSEGNSLSKEQIEYFKDSKIRDDEGNTWSVSKYKFCNLCDSTQG